MFTGELMLEVNDNGASTSGTGLDNELDPEGLVRYPSSLEKIPKIKHKLSAVSSIAYLPDDQLVVGDISRNVVKIFDVKGKFSNNLVRNVRPIGVATNRSGMVTIVDSFGRKKNEHIKVFDSGSREVFSQWGSDKSWHPRAVTFSNKGQLVITEISAKKHSVGIYTLDGRELHSFGTLGSGTHQFNNPWYVTVDMFDRILVSDRDNDCVKIFDDKGKYLGRIGRPGSGPGCLCRPLGICTDSRGNIIVCDSGNKRVCVFSVSGFYIQDLITKDDYLRYPWGIAYSRLSRRLAVSQAGNMNEPGFRKIRIFDLPELPPLKVERSYRNSYIH